MPKDLLSIILLRKTPQLLAEVWMISRVQLKAIFKEDNSFFDNPDNITDFSQKYVVTEDAIKMYVNHMKLLS